MKRTHQLSNGQQLTAETLRAHGVDLERILPELVSDPTSCGVLLTGSLAAGNGTPSSDVDLMVLVPHRTSLVTAREGMRFKNSRFSEALQYCDGIEVNIELAERGRVAEIMTWMTAIAPALYKPSELKFVPIIDGPELRFLHRLRTGVPLLNPSLVASWRDEFLVELLPTYLTVRHFMEVHEYLEDAISHRPTSEESSRHVARIAVEEALVSILATLGVTSASRKWLLIESRKAMTTAGEVDRALLAEGLSILADCAAGPLGDCLTRIEALHQRMAARMSAEPELARAVEFLQGSITYVLEHQA
ncbi:nucleotidyltransferase domain-containing protein [Myxococcus sp. AM001]|nr:nucleotidyltransferase domain-containing protein [Myxococcus sp. AM001]